MHSLVGRKNVLGPSREQPAGLNNHLLKNTVRNESPVQQYYGGASESTLPEIRRERNSSMQSLQGQQSQKRSGSTDERFNNYFEVIINNNNYRCILVILLIVVCFLI